MAVGALVGAVAAVAGGSSSSAKPSVLHRVGAGQLQRAVLHVNGITKPLPFFSGGVVTSAREMVRRTSARTSSRSGGPVSESGVAGAAIRSLGCSERNLHRNVRVNQDCTYRRQAEEDIAYNPLDPTNLVAGMNDSIVGWNQTSLDFSLDGGRHWGAISTAPFRYRLNAPDDLLPTAADPNQHTIKGDPGTFHSYDACSDPYLAFDSAGRAFYTCVTFDIASNASMVFVVPSPAGAKGSYFDQVPAPQGLSDGYTGREHMVVEDNSAAASFDGPKVAADANPQSPNRDNVYSTFTVFNFTCGANQDEYCSSTIYGFTWSTPEPISGANAGICVLGNALDPSADPAACNLNGHSDIAVLPTGDLAVSIQNGNTPTADQQVLAVHCHPTGSSPAGSAHLNCGTPVRVADERFATAPTCDFQDRCSPGAYIRVPVETSQRIAVDERTGDLFVTWYDYRFGEFDVFLSRSTDGGATWSPAQKVNPDSGSDHYQAAIDVGERYGKSRVGISYYRTERVPNENTPPDGGFALGQPGVGQGTSDYVLSSGTALHTPYEYAVLSPRFPAPDGNQAGFNGDYSGLVITPDNRAHPIWSDTRNRVPDPSFDHATVDEDVFTASHSLDVDGGLPLP
jgi:hypothetical protein